MFYPSDERNIQIEDDMLKVECHLTWKELKDIEETILEREKKILRVRRLDYDTLPTYFVSIKNLYGYILYKLGDVDGSINIFEEVLEKDPVNLNSVNNLAVLYWEIGKLKVAKKYMQISENIVKNAEQHIALYPRAFCERAHSIRHFQQDCRDFTYMPYLCKAIEFGAKINSPEKAEWLFEYGQALFRKDYQLVLAYASSEESEPNFEEAIRSFYDVILVKNGSKVYKALSWIFMGILLRHDKTRSLRRCFPSNSDIHELTSIQCIEKGLHLSPDNEIVMRRVASELSLVGCHERAKELFEKSLAKD
ncbi:uncharacterized protein LOC117102756 [Anneissia japonica]|uniref:uncharacterized protein LOC117102756 n=1 Tax=Anneissia japonica TaxID=1529436 RepID=UPI001425AE62|nr:uncharacterized protein LOC117102756 [Anneissia japonica]